MPKRGRSASAEPKDASPAEQSGAAGQDGEGAEGAKTVYGTRRQRLFSPDEDAWMLKCHFRCPSLACLEGQSCRDCRAGRQGVQRATARAGSACSARRRRLNAQVPFQVLPCKHDLRTQSCRGKARMARRASECLPPSGVRHAYAALLQPKEGAWMLKYQHMCGAIHAWGKTLGRMAKGTSFALMALPMHAKWDAICRDVASQTLEGFMNLDAVSRLKHHFRGWLTAPGVQVESGVWHGLAGLPHGAVRDDHHGHPDREGCPAPGGSPAEALRGELHALQGCMGCCCCCCCSIHVLV